MKMNKTEATAILETELIKFRTLPYKELIAIVDLPKRTTEIIAPSGTRYYVDILVYWDGAVGGDVRVTGTIDDGGVTAFVPMSKDFIKRADGSFR